MGINLFNAVGDWFLNLWISFWLLLDKIVYIFINWVYRVFILIAKIDIFSGGDQIEEITRRMYIIVGIAMLFIFAYNIILIIANPDGKQLGNMSKIIQNALFSIILVTLLPLIFSWLSVFQQRVVDSGIIGHIIFGSSNSTTSDNIQKSGGIDTSLTIFSAFFHPVGESKNSCENSSNSLCVTYVKAYEDAQNNLDFSYFIDNAQLKDAIKSGEMDYNYFISTIAGVIALWMFVSFALDIGVRVAKLALYEVISPIPVMMRILPNNGMFNKWKDALIDTYLSLFVRLAVIFLCMYAITLVPNVLNGMWAANGEWPLLALANIVVIFGILSFAQEAPKLISDLLGSKGGLDFSIGKKYKNAGKPLTSTLGRGADMVRSGIYSKKYGGADGEGGSFWAGAWRGRHGFNKGKEATDVRREVLSGGSTFGGRLQDRLRNAIGLKSRADAADFRTDMEIRRNGQLLDDQIRDVDGRIKTAERPLKDAKVEEREANNTEASNYRSNITNSIQQQARRSTSQFNYGGLKSNSYVNGNGKREDLSGKTYAELESLYNAGRTSGLASSELTKIKNQMDTRFYTDTSGNKVEISGTHQNLVSARDNAISSVGLHAKSDGSQYTVRELEVIKQSELAKGDRADADFVERLSGAINASKSVQQLEVDLKSSNMSFVDKNGKEQFISGNLNDIEMMYESARANGESGEVLKKLAQAKENAAKQIEKDILTSVIDGTAESKGVSADTVQEINDNRRYIVEMQSNDRLVKTVDSSGNSINISFDTGNASDDADAILKTLDSALKNDNNDIRNIKHDVENAKRDLEKEKKNYEKQKEDLEKNKKKNQQTQRYRSQRADADAVNKKNKGN